MEPDAAAIPAWNPWRSLRERPRAQLLWQRLVGTPGFVEVGVGGSEVIVLDPRVGRRQRRAVLAHELVHLDRGLLPAGTPRLVVDREEFQVRAETARRLVPGPALARMVAERSDVEGVTAAMVADEFDVPLDVAEVALAALAVALAAARSPGRRNRAAPPDAPQ